MQNNTKCNNNTDNMAFLGNGKTDTMGNTQFKHELFLKDVYEYHTFM